MKKYIKCPACNSKLQKGGTMVSCGLTLRCPKCRKLYKASAFHK